MMLKYKIISLTIISFVLILIGGCFFVINSAKFHLFQAAQAVGGYPYQIGLTKVKVVPCFTTGTPPVCNGGALCYTKDPVRCTLYSDVSGIPSGGKGPEALFLKQYITQAGLTPGGQLIAGGMSAVLMDNGVLGSAGGCAGCLAKANKIDKMKEIFDFIIASFKK